MTSPKLEEWINSPVIREALQPVRDKNFVDLDPVFNVNIDEDFDPRYSGITRNTFCLIYLGWIRYCNSRREKVCLNNNYYCRWIRRIEKMWAHIYERNFYIL